MTLTLPATADGISQAAGLLRSGKLVAFGTETVYGLGADATNAVAVAAIFQAKGRPRFNPLICHYAGSDAAFAHVQPNRTADILAAAFWPGPLTMVLPRRPACPVDPIAAAGLNTLAVRVPAHPVALALAQACGRPIAAPSANRSGGVSPTTAGHVLADLEGRIAAVLDCGPCPLGLESTVLDLTGPAPVLLRPGGIAADDIEAIAGRLAGQGEDAHRQPRAPGMLASHYAPRLRLRMNAATASQDEALLAFGAAPAFTGPIWNLSPAGDLTEAASRLFSGLRWLDAQGARLGLAGIAAMAIPDRGLGLAINDRLRRAAAPRS